MSRVRSLLGILWIALAVAVGQQAAILHELGHATENLVSKKDSAPLPKPCNKHFLCAELSSAAGAAMPALPLLSLAQTLVAGPLFASASIAARFAFNSRAPPTLL